MRLCFAGLDGGKEVRSREGCGGELGGQCAGEGLCGRWSDL